MKQFLAKIIFLGFLTSILPAHFAQANTPKQITIPAFPFYMGVGIVGGISSCICFASAKKYWKKTRQKKVDTTAESSSLANIGTLIDTDYASKKAKPEKEFKELDEMIKTIRMKIEGPILTHTNERYQRIVDNEVRKRFLLPIRERYSQEFDTFCRSILINGAPKEVSNSYINFSNLTSNAQHYFDHCQTLEPYDTAEKLNSLKAANLSNPAQDDLIKAIEYKLELCKCNESMAPRIQTLAAKLSELEAIYTRNKNTITLGQARLDKKTKNNHTIKTGIYGIAGMAALGATAYGLTLAFRSKRQLN